METPVTIAILVVFATAIAIIVAQPALRAAGEVGDVHVTGTGVYWDCSTRVGCFTIVLTLNVDSDSPLLLTRMEIYMPDAIREGQLLVTVFEPHGIIDGAYRLVAPPTVPPDGWGAVMVNKRVLEPGRNTLIITLMPPYSGEPADVTLILESPNGNLYTIRVPVKKSIPAEVETP